MKLRHSQQRAPFEHIRINVWLILHFMNCRQVRKGWVMQMPTEQELIAQAHRGDEQAVTRLYKMHVDTIFESMSYGVGSRNMGNSLDLRVVLSCHLFYHVILR
jgi:hypothetical protein